MLDARDAMLAADRMRFGGDDQKVMWDAFASRGMGEGASTPDADRATPTPSFAVAEVDATPGSPWPRPLRQPLRRSATRPASTPVADTRQGTKARRGLLAGPRALPDGARRRRGHGFQRFTLTVKAGQRKTLRLTRAEEPGRHGQRRPDPRRQRGLAQRRVPHRRHRGHQLGRRQRRHERRRERPAPVRRRSTSPVACRPCAGCRSARCCGPAPADPSDIPLAGGPGLGLAVHRAAPVRAGGLHQQAAPAPARRGSAFYTSSADAFPGARPRPVAPNLIMRGLRRARHARGGDPVRGPGEPVHRLRRLRRRAGQRPAERHRLQGGLGPRQSVRAAELQVY